MGWLLAMLALASADPSAPGASSRLSRPHAALVSRWLVRRPGWRLAERHDCADCRVEPPGPINAFLPRPPRSDRDPFYVHGDLDGDGVEDCVVVVVRRSVPERRLVLVFSGGAAPSLAWPIAAQETIAIWPDTTDASKDRNRRQRRVVLGPVDGEPGRFIVWHPGRFVVRPTGW